MGIKWSNYGWDCPDCGAFAGTWTGQTIHDAGPEVYALMTKAAADHARACPALATRGPFPRDLRARGEYNEGVPTEPPPGNDSNDPGSFDPFAGYGLPIPPPMKAPETTLADPKLNPPEPETVMAGIERILTEDRPHARKQAEVAPHENYRLRPEDRISGHPTRPD